MATLKLLQPATPTENRVPCSNFHTERAELGSRQAVGINPDGRRRGGFHATRKPALAPAPRAGSSTREPRRAGARRSISEPRPPLRLAPFSTVPAPFVGPPAPRRHDAGSRHRFVFSLPSFFPSLSVPLSLVPALPDDSGLDDRPNTRLSLTVSLGSFCRMLPNDAGFSQKIRPIVT